jgi:hypothetical protein
MAKTWHYPEICLEELRKTTKNSGKMMSWPRLESCTSWIQVLRFPSTQKYNTNEITSIKNQHKAKKKKIAFHCYEDSSLLLTLQKSVTGHSKI